MKNIFKDKQNSNFLGSVAWGTGTGFVVMFVLLLVSALIMSAAALNVSAGKVIAVAVLGVAALISGMVAAKRSGSKVLLTGAASGALLYLIVAVISAAVTKEGFSSVFLVRMTVCVVSAVVGALIIALKSGSKKYI